MKAASIFKKTLMAVTGLGLIGFLFTHLAGNLLLFKGSGAFNAYAAYLESNVFLAVAETGLFLIFLVHVVTALQLTGENNAARPVDYDAKQTAGESTLASRTMMITGVVIFIFIVIHIWTFKFGDHSGTGGLYGLVIRTFSHPLWATWYVLAMIVMGLHLSHATSSIFQSLGLLKPGWRPKARRIGALVGWGLALGFALLPLWVFVTKPAEADKPLIVERPIPMTLKNE